MPHLVYRISLFVLLLLANMAVAQQPPAVRQLRQRGVVLPARPGGVAVRIARGFVTTLTFDSALAVKGVQLQGRDTHFERVDENERAVTLKPRVELAEGERLMLTVRFADSAAPQEATFELVPGRQEVDAQVEVVRRVRSAEVLEAELANTQARYAALQDRCGEGGPAGVYLAKMLDPSGVLYAEFKAKVSAAHPSGLTAENGAGFRATAWGLVVVHVRLAPTGRPWTLGEAHLVSKSGRPVKVKSLRMDKSRLVPGEGGIVLVETEAPWWTRDEELLLELRDGGGQVSLRGIMF